MRQTKCFAATILAISMMGACADTAETPASEAAIETSMTPKKMTEIIQNFDEDARINANQIAFELREREMLLIFDENADRMRVVSGIMQAGSVPEHIHTRMLQANFDAVLDSRYAIASDIVWSVYIHRLSSLSEDDLKSGIAQTYTAAETFGSTYNSGAMVFGGGDSNSIYEDLLEELEKQDTKEDQGI